MTWFPLLVAGALALDALLLRRRLAALLPLRGSAGGDPAGYEFVYAAGVEPPPAMLRAAADHARRNGLEVLDLIPADLPAERALDLARTVDPRRYVRDPIAPGRGAGHCTLAEAGTLERAGVRPGPLDPGEYGEVTERLRHYSRAAGLAVVPAPAGGSHARREWLRGLGVPTRRILAPAAAWYALPPVALAADPAAGLAALAAYCAVPYIAVAGTALRPRDLRAAGPLRPLLVPREAWRTCRAPRSAWERRRAERERRERERVGAELARGTARVPERPRDDCPWCGSFASHRHVAGGDVVRLGPGRFTLERCRDCGHVFQNPRLAPAGLDFYGPGDPYEEGPGEGCARQRARAALVRAHATPRAWLDVGAGRGAFCRVARTALPHTVFDGLDGGTAAAEGVRRGWLRRGIRGRFAERVDELAGRYDVVSMHHYLQRTREPLAELDAAVKILGPGGHLLIELPDPEWPAAALLRRFWWCWGQPRHQHLIPIENLAAALRARGMTIVARQRRAAHRPRDFRAAIAILLATYAPAPGGPGALPWLRRAAGLLLAAGPAAVAPVLDRLLVPLLPGPGNAYRVLARKEPG